MEQAVTLRLIINIITKLNARLRLQAIVHSLLNPVYMGDNS